MRTKMLNSELWSSKFGWNWEAKLGRLWGTWINYLAIRKTKGGENTLCMVYLHNII